MLLWDVSELSRHFEVYRAFASAPIWIGLRVLSLLIALAAGLWLWTRRFSRSPSAAFMRGMGYALALALLAGSLQWQAGGTRWEVRMTFMTVLPLAWAGWAIGFGAFRLRPGGGPSTALHRAEFVISSSLLSLLAMELGLLLWSTRAPSPLVAGSGPEAELAAMRRPAYAHHLGGRLNSQGFADQEFFEAGPDDLVVAVISDSFGLAVVPPASNFVQIAEAELQRILARSFDRIAVHNFGVPGAGLPAYALLLETEVAPMNPSVVVLCVFIGNDILDGSGWGDPIRERYALQNWILWNAARRASRLAVYESNPPERVRLAEPDARGVGLEREQRPQQDSPTFSEARFMEIERSRLGVTHSDRSRTLSEMRGFLEGVDWFHRQRGEQLLVVLIPDEFQVNDRLWADLLAEDPEPDRFRRDWPQETILEYCRSNGISCLDLLPILRQAEAQARTYRPRDTHWNLRGNRVAGESLGLRLAEMSQNRPLKPAPSE